MKAAGAWYLLGISCLALGGPQWATITLGVLGSLCLVTAK